MEEGHKVRNRDTEGVLGIQKAKVCVEKVDSSEDNKENEIDDISDAN